MSVSPSWRELKWSSIYHPFGVANVVSDPDTYHGATSIQNQTSLIGGAPNKRTLISGTSYSSEYEDGAGYDTNSVTPEEYDWCIGYPHIECNHWDRKLKVQDLRSKKAEYSTDYHFNYLYDEEKIKLPKYKYWVLRIPAGMPAYNGNESDII